MHPPTADKLQAVGLLQMHRLPEFMDGCFKDDGAVVREGVLRASENHNSSAVVKHVLLALPRSPPCPVRTRLKRAPAEMQLKVRKQARETHTSIPCTARACVENRIRVRNSSLRVASTWTHRFDWYQVPASARRECQIRTKHATQRNHHLTSCLVV